jgi:TonB-linked SusC/RagA family outer membrane protein
MKKKGFLLLLLLVLWGISYSQQYTVTGKVTTAEDGSSLPGVSIAVKGTSTGTITDIDGNYSLNTKDKDAILVFAFVGMRSQQIPVDGHSIINVTLESDVLGVDEVVVVGYGVMKKSLVTGSISKVSNEEIASAPSQRIEQALQGKTSGVVFNQTSGNPGAQVSVRIRGVSSNSNTDPLFIIDGMKTSKYVMNELDPVDIESVEVLKDGASAAIYGSEGANGVIIITTKSGKNNKGKTVITYDAYYGFQKASPVKVMTANEYRDYFAETFAYKQRLALVGGLDLNASVIHKLVPVWNTPEEGVVFKYNTPEFKYNTLKTKLDEAYSSGLINQGQYDTNMLELTKKKPLSFEEYKAQAYRSNSGFSPFAGNIDTLSTGTDWMNEIFQTAPIQKHHLSLSSSTEKTDMYLSASYFSQDGVVGGAKNNFSRYNIKVNVDHQAKDWLKVGTHLLVAESKSRNLPINSIYNNTVLSAMSFDPTLPVYWNNKAEIPTAFKSIADSMLKTSDGRYYTISKATSGERVNPLASIAVNQNNTTTTDRVVGDIYAEITPIKGLNYRFSAKGDFSLVSLDDWQPKYYYGIEYKNDHSFVSKELQAYYKYQIDNVITYSKKIASHDFSILLGNSAEKIWSNSVRARRSDLFIENDNFAIIDHTPVTSDNIELVQTGGFRNIQTKLSYFGRINYNYQEKYLLTTTLRSDGSSMFEESHRFGTFPSVSLGWNINRESFFNVPSISLLKLRASWGQNGSLSSVSPYMWITTSTVSSGGNQVVKNATYNKDLQWETSEQSNIGIDLGLFNNKLTITTELYDKRTKGLLAKPEAVAWTSGSVPYYNVGSVSNKGVEFDLGYSDKKGAFNYDMKLTAAYLKNKVTDFQAALLPGFVLFSGRQQTMFVEGQPAWYFQGYKVLGIFQNWEEIRNYTAINPKTGNPVLIQPGAQPGDPKIQDIGGSYDTKGNPIPDGKISSADYTYLGKPLPSWTFGLSLNCEYKGFDASMFIYSEVDKTIFNALTRDDRTYYNRPERFYTERWTESNPTNSFIRATNENIGGYAFGHNSFFFEDGSFLRLKNIQVGYTFPTSLTKKAQIDKLRIYVSASNLITLTNYSGSDPEIGQTQAENSYSYGVDMGLYPSAKQFIAGINVTF